LRVSNLNHNTPVVQTAGVFSLATRPEGAEQISPGQRPGYQSKLVLLALKGRNIKHTQSSVPRVSLIKLNAMPLQERSELILERQLPMMHFLTLDVAHHL
jgi:hypothetical protein